MMQWQLFYSKSSVNICIINIKYLGSVFEDAAHIATNLTDDKGLDAHVVFQILWQFLYTVVLSLLIGVGIGLISTWLFKNCRFLKNPVC